MARFEYAAALEPRELADLRPSHGLFVGGEFIDPLDGGAITSVNPADEGALSMVAVADAADVDRAVRAARAAYTGAWGRLPGQERAKHLFRLAGLIFDRARELAVLETLDTGAPIRASRDVDLPLVAAHFFYYAGWADKLSYAGFGPDPRPLGVVGALTGWRSPLLTLAWQVAPALAGGNTVVLQPAATTSLTALRFAELCQQAGLPPGVVNVLPGSAATGAAVVTHPGVATLSYAGVAEVGRQVARAVAGTGKRLALALDGEVAHLVFDDAPLDEAVEGIVEGSFFHPGRAGCAGSRLLVQESIQEELLAALKRRVAGLRIGDPLDNNTDIGAIAAKAHLARLRTLVRAGQAEGARPWSAPGTLPQRGHWFAPTIVTEVSQVHQLAREPIAGPVLPVLRFRTPEEAVTKANAIPYASSAGVWSEKGSQVLAVADRLRAGVVWANTGPKFDPASPFGGYRQSGYGQAGGRHGLEAYLA